MTCLFIYISKYHLPTNVAPPHPTPQEGIICKMKMCLYVTVWALSKMQQLDLINAFTLTWLPSHPKNHFVINVSYFWDLRIRHLLTTSFKVRQYALCSLWCCNLNNIKTDQSVVGRCWAEYLLLWFLTTAWEERQIAFWNIQWRDVEMFTLKPFDSFSWKIELGEVLKCTFYWIIPML